MKILKVSLLLLGVSLLVSSIATFATNVKKYAGIELAAFRGEYVTGKYYKEVDGYQYYENEYNINNCTGNYNDISVKVTNEQGDATGWQIISKGNTKTWGKDSNSNISRYYKLTIRNDVWGLCTSSHSGNWYLEK